MPRLDDYGDKETELIIGGPINAAQKDMEARERALLRKPYVFAELDWSLIGMTKEEGQAEIAKILEELSPEQKEQLKVVKDILDTPERSEGPNQPVCDCTDCQCNRISQSLSEDVVDHITEARDRGCLICGENSFANGESFRLTDDGILCENCHCGSSPLPSAPTSSTIDQIKDYCQKNINKKELWVSAHDILDIIGDSPLPSVGVSTGAPAFHAALAEIAALHDRKQLDYGRPTDPFANVRASADFGIPAWVGTLVRANDKMKRLQKAASGGTLANEGVEDSLLDLATYAIIALVLWREGNA